MFQSLEEVRDLMRSLPGPDEAAAELARARDPILTKPPGSLGRLEELSLWLSAWQGRHPPQIERPAIAVFAGAHGVTQLEVSA